MRWRKTVAGLTAALGSLALATPAGAATITEFSAYSDGAFSFPVNITSGPEGNLWWTDKGTQPGIYRMSPSGERLPAIADPVGPVDVVVAMTGWATWSNGNGTVSRSPTGTQSSQLDSAVPGAVTLTSGNRLRWGRDPNSGESGVCGPEADHLIVGPQTCEYIPGTTGRVTGLAESAGALWGSFYEDDLVGVFAAAPLAFQKKVELPSESGPTGIAVDPSGDVWVAMWKASAIDRFTPSGSRTRFSLPAGSRPNDVVLGPDGALWITESGTGKIGRMTTDGALTNEYPVPSGETNQIGITVGPDGNIWFTDPEAGKIGRLVPDPPTGEQPSGDDVAPRFLGSPSFSPKRFRARGRPSAQSSKRRGAPIGSKLLYKLSEPASVTATVARKAAGRKAGRKCVAPGKPKPKASRCPRWLKVGALTLQGGQGANRTRFSGRLKGKALRPGAYRAALIARDAAGNSSTAKKAGFTVVR